jgi:hypothetical protein
MAPVGPSLDVEPDFDSIWTQYLGFARVANSAALRTEFKAIHRFACGLSLLSQQLSAEPEHARIFLGECASDSVHVLHSLLCGDRRGSEFYLRSLLENIWRHIYYRDHSVEYEWLHTRAGYYLGFDDLRDYARHLALLQPVLASLDALKTEYTMLSRMVHSSTAPTLLLHQKLNQIVVELADVKGITAMLRSTGRDVMLLLLVIHHDAYRRLHPREQRFLLSFLDSRRKTLRLKFK